VVCRFCVLFYIKHMWTYLSLLKVFAQGYVFKIFFVQADSQTLRNGQLFGDH